MTAANHSQYTSRSIVSLSGLSVSDPLPGSLESTKNRSASISSLGTYEEDETHTSVYHYGNNSHQVISILFCFYLLI